MALLLMFLLMKFVLMDVVGFANGDFRIDDYSFQDGQQPKIVSIENFGYWLSLILGEQEWKLPRPILIKGSCRRSCVDTQNRISKS